jgi:hypothetical protein
VGATKTMFVAATVTFTIAIITSVIAI